MIRIIDGLPERVCRQAHRFQRKPKAKWSGQRIVTTTCKKDGVLFTELRNGSRRGRLPEIRAEIVRELIELTGMPIADVARQVGIWISRASKILTRDSVQLVNSVRDTRRTISFHILFFDVLIEKVRVPFFSSHDYDDLLFAQLITLATLR